MTTSVTGGRPPAPAPPSRLPLQQPGAAGAAPQLLVEPRAALAPAGRRRTVSSPAVSSTPKTRTGPPPIARVTRSRSSTLTVLV
ncbi:hypothetical protein [Nonomuraea sp. NPDC049309]|uniref:hypothetical protein n=1 Tax=Nonomuraea sp. NPDC049309 TaxID=3364350 RepID=UPI003719708F